MPVGRVECGPVHDDDNDNNDKDAKPTYERCGRKTNTKLLLKSAYSVAPLFPPSLPH